MAKKNIPLEKKILEGLAEFSQALRDGDESMGRLTSRKVELNLASEPYDPKRIRETRDILGVSQSIFAKFLGVSSSTVQKWERGEDHPQLIACRFMDEIRNDPDHWRGRLLKAAVPKASA